MATINTARAPTSPVIDLSGLQRLVEGHRKSKSLGSAISKSDAGQLILKAAGSDARGESRAASTRLSMLSSRTRAQRDDARRFLGVVIERARAQFGTNPDVATRLTQLENLLETSAKKNSDIKVGDVRDALISISSAASAALLAEIAAVSKRIDDCMTAIGRSKEAVSAAFGQAVAYGVPKEDGSFVNAFTSMTQELNEAIRVAEGPRQTAQASPATTSASPLNSSIRAAAAAMADFTRLMKSEDAGPGSLAAITSDFIGGVQPLALLGAQGIPAKMAQTLSRFDLHFGKTFTDLAGKAGNGLKYAATEALAFTTKEFTSLALIGHFLQQPAYLNRLGDDQRKIARGLGEAVENFVTQATQESSPFMAAVRFAQNTERDHEAMRPVVLSLLSQASKANPKALDSQAADAAGSSPAPRRAARSVLKRRDRHSAIDQESAALRQFTPAMQKKLGLTDPSAAPPNTAAERRRAEIAARRRSVG